MKRNVPHPQLRAARHPGTLDLELTLDSYLARGCRLPYLDASDELINSLIPREDTRPCRP